jgi:hypothetical protein
MVGFIHTTPVIDTSTSAQSMLFLCLGTTVALVLLLVDATPAVSAPVWPLLLLPLLFVVCLFDGRLSLVHLLTSLFVEMWLMSDRSAFPYFRLVQPGTVCTRLLSRKDNFIKVLEILANFTSPNSPAQGNCFTLETLMKTKGVHAWPASTYWMRHKTRTVCQSVSWSSSTNTTSNNKNKSSSPKRHEMPYKFSGLPCGKWRIVVDIGVGLHNEGTHGASSTSVIWHCVFIGGENL